MVAVPKIREAQSGHGGQNAGAFPLEDLKMHRILFMLVAVAATLSAQTTRNVPAQFPTIQIAISVAQNGDTVLVAAGVYNESINFLGKAITVISAAGPATTTILAATGQRAVTFATNEGPGSILSGFTITGGNGGVQITRASPTFINCTISGNLALNSGGGGVRIVSNQTGVNTAPSFSNCRILNNGSLGSSTGTLASGSNDESVGGGLCALVTAGGTFSLTMTGCTISGNSALSAGGGGIGVYQFTGNGMTLPTNSVNLTQCVVADNAGMNQGGGILVLDGTVATFNRCIIRGNTAVGPQSLGGGLSVQANGSSNVVGCQIIGNSAGAQGGAIQAVPSYGSGNPVGGIVIQGSTIIDNFASTSVYSQTFSTTIISSIIRGGAAIPAFGQGSGPAISYSNIEGVYGALPTNMDVDPRFVDAAAGDYHLASNSPCVNAGALGTIPAPPTDLDGAPRLVGPIDIGADERPNPAFPGSGADLDLYVRINGAGDPLASTVAGPSGSQLGVQLRSPGGTLVGVPVMIAGQLYVTGSVLPLNPAFPMIQINAFGTVLLYSTVGGAAFSQPGLSAAGVSLAYLIPPGLAGATLRLQAFAVTPLVGPLGFVATDARDVTL